ncbi:MAG: hypothetical protein R3C30_16550 [Hyphomonadaceae bacterium]
MAACLVSCSGRDQNLPDANIAACAVYQAFYEQLPNKGGVFFRSATLPLPPIAGGPLDQHTELEAQLHLEGRRDSVLQRFQQEFSIDASGYFDDLASPSTSVASCFGDGKPPIHDGTLDQARLRAALQSFGLGADTSLVMVSPVAFSRDGLHAIIYVNQECGGLCGGGAFYVFERRGAWVRVGTLGVWVS